MDFYNKTKEYIQFTISVLGTVPSILNELKIYTCKIKMQKDTERIFCQSIIEYLCMYICKKKSNFTI